MKHIYNNPVWVSFKKFCYEYRSDITAKGVPGHRLEYFLTNLTPKESKYSGQFLQDLAEAGYIQIDAKKRFKLTESGEKFILNNS